MKITVLIDNKTRSELTCEWGLSFYIQNDGRKILLDAGASDYFAENAAKLGVDLKDVELSVLSHAHYDHANGLPKFLDINNESRLYVAGGCRENCFDRWWIFAKYIGVPKGMLDKYRDRITYVDKLTEIEKGIYLMPHPAGTEKIRRDIGKGAGMFQKNGHRWTPDNFNHEQSLIFETEKGLVVFNSCSHGGPDNIINDVQDAFPGARVYAMIGGFHQYRKKETEVRALADRMAETGTEVVITGHCTGDNQFKWMKDQLEGRAEVVQMYTGMEMEI